MKLETGSLVACDLSDFELWKSQKQVIGLVMQGQDPHSENVSVHIIYPHFMSDKVMQICPKNLEFIVKLPGQEGGFGQVTYSPGSASLRPGLLVTVNENPTPYAFRLRGRNNRIVWTFSRLFCQAIYLCICCSFNPTVEEKYPTLQMPSFSK